MLSTPEIMLSITRLFVAIVKYKVFVKLLKKYQFPTQQIILKINSCYKTRLVCMYKCN